MKIWCIFVFCLTGFLVQGQQRDDIYHLDFKDISASDFSWIIAPFRAGEGGSRCEIDTLNIIGGKHPLVFRSIEMLPGSRSYYHFCARLSQQIFIPGNYRQLEFVLNARSQNITRGWLKVTGLDRAEQYLCRDSVQINGGTDWHLYKLTISRPEACFFRIEICAEGGEDWLNTSVFSIGRMQILGDGESIDWTKILPVLSDRSFEFIDSWPEEIMPHLKNKKVIALAETVHGDSLIAETERKFINMLVREGDCKLVFLELPFDLVLLYNRYIQGDSGIDGEELLQYTQNIQCGSDFLIALLNDLREYNRLTNKKVYMVGVDRMTWEPQYLRRFLECIPGEGRQAVCDLLFQKTDDVKIQEIIKELENNKNLLEGWDRMDIYWLLQALRQLADQEEIRRSAIGIKGIWGRERIMKDNIITMVDSLLAYDKKAVIIGHWLHFNKVNCLVPVMEKSCGYYLNHRFGNAYEVIGLLKGEGKIWCRNYGIGKLQQQKLELPSGAEFLETLCNQRTGICFGGKCLDEHEVGWIRISGASSNRVLGIPIAFSRRMDCFLWVK